MRKGTAGQSGLTLIEVMIALVVSSLVLGGAWSLFDHSMSAYRRGLHEVALTQEARTVLAIMTRDIQRAVPNAISPGIRGMNPGRQVTPDQPAAVNRLAITTVVYPAAQGHQAPTERLVSVQRIRYSLEPSVRGTLATLALKRAAASLDHDGIEQSIALSERLHGLHLRYYDGQAWYDEWQRPGLPRAVEIAIVLQNSARDARPHRFATLVALE